MSKPFKLKFLDVSVVRGLPDGDYTIGRGADPRAAAERAVDPDGSIARGRRESSLEMLANTGTPKRVPPQAAE